MARTTGPLMSLDASGSVGGTLTYSKWKGRNYVRQLVIPANPQSAMQTAMRAMFKFLGSQWSGIDPTDQDSWNGQADNDKVSDFNAYMKLNQAGWANRFAPSWANPPQRNDTAATLTTLTATGGPGVVQLNIDLAVINQNWGLIVYRNLVTGFTPALSDVIAVIDGQSASLFHYVDSPLAPDTYFYVVQPFTQKGFTGAAFTEVSGTAT